MKLGVVLPAFTGDGRLTARVAVLAEAAGLDGGFVFDHLWPIGGPGRPALACMPALAVAAAATTRITLGPLVARAGLPDEAGQLAAFETVAAVAGARARVIAALGVSDRLSRPEFEAYGLPFGSSAERFADADTMLRLLRERGFETWIGGRSPASRRAAARHGAALNVWNATASELAVEAHDLRSVDGGAACGVTWAGQVLVAPDPAALRRKSAMVGGRPDLVAGTAQEVADHLRSLDRAAGSLTWVVCAPLDLTRETVDAIENLGEVRRVLALA